MLPPPFSVIPATPAVVFALMVPELITVKPLLPIIPAPVMVPVLVSVSPPDPSWMMALPPPVALDIVTGPLKVRLLPISRMALPPPPPAIAMVPLLVMGPTRTVVVPSATG